MAPAIPSLKRMALYRELAAQRKSRGDDSLTSAQMGAYAGEGSFLVRKDLQVLGLETQGRSYPLDGLLPGLDSILSSPQKWAVVGLGDLGLHLVRRMDSWGFSLGAVFDAKPNRLDQLDLGIPAFPAYEIPQRVPSLGITAAVLAVPPGSVGVTVERLVQGGIKGILNLSRGLVRQNLEGVAVINGGFELQLLLLGALVKGNFSERKGSDRNEK